MLLLSPDCRGASLKLALTLPFLWTSQVGLIRDGVDLWVRSYICSFSILFCNIQLSFEIGSLHLYYSVRGKSIEDALRCDVNHSLIFAYNIPLITQHSIYIFKDSIEVLPNLCFVSQECLLVEMTFSMWPFYSSPQRRPLLFFPNFEPGHRHLP